jgi:Ca2+-transporting ATPase
MHREFKGLSEAEVVKSQEKYGKNIIIEKPPATLWERIKDGFSDPMIKLLCAIVIIMLVLFAFGQAEWYEPVGTAIAILLVTIISAKTGMASDDEYRKLKNQTKAEPVKVKRNGVVTVIDIEDIVVGDIVILQSGDKIPADGVLVDGELRVDNSALNGEAEECKKFAASEDFKIPDEITGDTFVDEHSLFRGATIYNGEGLLEVQKVGMETMMGKMAKDMHDDEVESPLQVKLSKLAHQISTFGYIGAIVIAIAYFVHFVIVAGGLNAYLAIGGVEIFKDVIEALTLAIVIVVCAVPEGLPLMISLVLMVNTGTMLKHNVLVRKPIGIETAGSLNILFSDKTGTITKGKLEVVEFFKGNGNSIKLTELPKDTVIKGYVDLAIGKNTTAMFDDEHKVIGGNATDHALMTFIGEKTFNLLKDDPDCEVTEQQSFNSSNKFSQSYIAKAKKTFYKGAPERLLAKATKYLDSDGKEKELDIGVVNHTIDNLAAKAMRVLAFGYSNSPMVEDTINDDIVIIGFVGIRDDVRPEAVEAIDKVQKAGIQVVMITGDRKETAMAIAKDAGLLHTGEVALTSDELNKMSDDEVKGMLSKIRVIARALPTDKSRMVRLCQEMNLVTGMTGDGVNDSPALKRADVGFAMGSGTAVAKEAGDIVIVDDNFKSIKDAILYGRTIYHNILKFCKFQLSINVGAVLTSAVLPFIGVEEALTVIHLLFVNLCMDSLGSLMLGMEPAMDYYLDEKPRRRDESIVSKNMFIQFTFMGVYLLILGVVWFTNGFIGSLFETPEQLKTGFFAAFMFSAIINGLNVRSEGFDIFKGVDQNKNFFKVMLVMLAATVFLCVVGGPIGDVFSCTRFAPIGWVAVIIAGILVIPVDMLRKLIFGTYKETKRH